MPQFTTRPARPEDAEALVRVQRLAVEKAWRPLIRENFDAFLAERFNTDSQIAKYRERTQDPDRILIVAECDGIITGFAGARKQEPDEQPLSYEYQMNALYVDPAHEGKGIGTLLMSHLQKILENLDVKNMCLWCIEENELARNFYEKRSGKLITDAVAPEEYSNTAPHVAYGWRFQKENS